MVNIFFLNLNNVIFFIEKTYDCYQTISFASTYYVFFFGQSLGSLFPFWPGLGIFAQPKEIQSIYLPLKYVDLEDGREKFRMQEMPIIDPDSVVHYLLERGGLEIPKSALQQF